MKPKNAVMLLLTSLIWGTAFVAQSVGMDFLEPFTFNGVRSFIGGVTLLPCIWLLEELPVVCFYLQQAASNRWGFSTQQQERRDLLPHFILCLFRSLGYF